MTRLWIAGLAVAGMFAGTNAFAQDETLTIQPEQRTVIHDYVVKEKMRPVQVQEDLSNGTAVPTEVELQPVPEAIYEKVPAAKRYEYFDWNGRIVFVDPDSRKVVQIVD
ncbi:MAG TPA: DUF1236 domain-containing protein [Rhizomicrobium sp.]